jgi:hypothetical protein
MQRSLRNRQITGFSDGLLARFGQAKIDVEFRRVGVRRVFHQSEATRVLKRTVARL